MMMVLYGRIAKGLFRYGTTIPETQPTGRQGPNRISPKMRFAFDAPLPAVTHRSTGSCETQFSEGLRQGQGES